MPGMQPGRGGPPPGITSDRIPDLAKLNEQMLVQLFNLSMTNQIQKPSPISILSAISEKQKQKQAQAAVAGAVAQGQNAQNQQGGTIAQQLVGPLMQQRAAQGGAMQGYAGGGIVAFADGDAVWRKRLLAAGVPESFIAELEARRAEPEQIESDARRAGYMGAQTSPVAPPLNIPPPEQRDVTQRIKDAIADARAKSAAGLSVSQRLAQATQGAPAPLTEIPAVETFSGKSGDPDVDIGMRERGKSGIESVDIGTRPPVSAATPRVRPPAAPVADLPLRGKTGDPNIDIGPAAPTAPVTDRFADYIKELEARKQVPEEVARGRTGIDALVREEMEARKARLAQDRAAAEQRRQEALERAPGVFSPEGLLGIAASIDPRRGYELGSAARGAFGVMGAQRKAQEEARKEFREFEKAERTEQNLLSQMRVLEAQRQQAIIENKVEKANQITDKINEVRKEQEAVARAKEEKAREFALAEERNRIAAEGVGVQREAARRPTETQEKIALFKSNPQMYKEMYGDKAAVDAAKLSTIFNNDPRLKKLAETLALDPTNPDALAQYAAREKELTAKYAPEMLLGGAAPATGKPATSSARSAADAIISGGQ